MLHLYKLIKWKVSTYGSRRGGLAFHSREFVVTLNWLWSRNRSTFYMLLQICKIVCLPFVSWSTLMSIRTFRLLHTFSYSLCLLPCSELWSRNVCLSAWSCVRSRLLGWRKKPNLSDSFESIKSCKGDCKHFSSQWETFTPSSRSKENLSTEFFLAFITALMR